MDAGHVIPEAIRELLEKRGTFQEWLARLDRLGSEYRPEVAQKVRSDYAGRLREVESELEGHRAELETALAARTAAVGKVAAEHDALSAELEETQLRHVVGEFDDSEWERRRSEHQVQIDELEAELTAQRSAVDSLQNVLSELTGEAGVSAFAGAIQAETPAPGEAVVADDDDTAWMTQPFDDTPEDAPEVEEPEEDAEAIAEHEAQSVEQAEEVVALEEEEEAEVLEEVEVAGQAEEGAVEKVPALDEAESGDFMDELEFLESLSLDDADNFDAVSAMLDEEEGDAGGDAGSRRETGDL